MVRWRHRPEPAQIIGTATGLVNAANRRSAAVDGVVRPVVVDSGTEAGRAHGQNLSRSKDYALEAAQFLKSRNPNSVVKLKDLEGGKRTSSHLSRRNNDKCSRYGSGRSPGLSCR